MITLYLIIAAALIIAGAVAGFMVMISWGSTVRKLPTA